jgi:cytochrome b subunit of formate dehydrogenase
MKDAVEMGSGAMMYIPSFIKIGSWIQKLIGEDLQTAWRLHKPTSIFQNKEIRLKIVYYCKNCD